MLPTFVLILCLIRAYSLLILKILTAIPNYRHLNALRVILTGRIYHLCHFLPHRQNNPRRRKPVGCIQPGNSATPPYRIPLLHVFRPPRCYFHNLLVLYLSDARILQSGSNLFRCTPDHVYRPEVAHFPRRARVLPDRHDYRWCFSQNPKIRDDKFLISHAIFHRFFVRFKALYLGLHSKLRQTENKHESKVKY